METSPQSRSRQPEHEQGHTMVAEAVPELGIYIQHVQQKQMYKCPTKFRGFRLFVALALFPC